MNQARSYLTSGLVALLLTGSLFFLEISVPVFEAINVKGRDIFFRLQHTLKPVPPEADQIVLINLDDETLRRLELRWPYPRSIYAEALKRLRPYSPKAIGFDLIFSGSDFSPGSDAEFAKALKEAGNVVIASHRNVEGEVGPSPSIRQNVWGVGVVDKPRDQDHIIRRSYFSLPIAGEEHNSWELELFTKAFSQAETQNLPRNSDVIVNFRLRFNDFQQVSFWRLLEGSLLAKEIQNKIVLIGLTAEAFHDIHATPLGSMPGIAVNANVILTMIRKDFFSWAPRWTSPLLTFLSCWIALLFASSGSVLIGIWTILFLSGLYLFVSFSLFSNQVILDPWSLILSTIGTFIVAGVFREAQLLLENLRLREESSRDSLTGFYNRRFLTLKLKSEFRKFLAKRGFFRTPEEISVIMLDLDNFKLINDSFGHAEGDRVLCAMAEAIRSSVRKQELVCRYGGDELCIILPGTSIGNAAQFAEKIRTVIASHPDLSYRTKDGTDTVRVTASIGVASVAGTKILEHGSLLKAADRALYRAKSGGRNRVCIYDPQKDVIR